VKTTGISVNFHLLYEQEDVKFLQASAVDTFSHRIAYRTIPWRDVCRCAAMGGSAIRFDRHHLY
jgi:hypothetical protein